MSVLWAFLVLGSEPTSPPLPIFLNHKSTKNIVYIWWRRNLYNQIKLNSNIYNLNIHMVQKKLYVSFSIPVGVYVCVCVRKCILFLIFRLCHILIKTVWIIFCKYFIDAIQFAFEYTWANAHSHAHTIVSSFSLLLLFESNFGCINIQLSCLMCGVNLRLLFCIHLFVCLQLNHFNVK